MFFLRSWYDRFKTPLEEKLISENKNLKKKYKVLIRDLEEINKGLTELKSQDEDIYRVVLCTEPAKEQKKSLEKKKYNESELALVVNKVSELKKKIEDQKQSYAHITSLANKRLDYFNSIPAIQPISNKNLKRIGDCYGMRKCHPVHLIPKMHYGIDYVASHGTQVYATGAGTIKTAKFVPGYGNMIEVQHSKDVVTRYCHLSAFNAKVGDKVIRGQCIGYVGQTGTATGPHLHYEIIKNYKQVDPTSYFFAEISPSQYEEILELASKRMGQYKI